MPATACATPSTASSGVTLTVASAPADDANGSPTQNSSSQTAEANPHPQTTEELHPIASADADESVRSEVEENAIGRRPVELADLDYEDLEETDPQVLIRLTCQGCGVTGSHEEYCHGPYTGFYGWDAEDWEHEISLAEQEYDEFVEMEEDVEEWF
ncbi:hypothetical protein FPV67DRAFT_1676648 [Lyophyllum atratum]|nr:hypothetical protein FPV67DRAFT_1676648 [Lyophyllum atratum]